MYVIYDTETSGTRIRFDQVLQFAAVAADDDFAERNAFEIRLRPLPWIIPAPTALLVTGISPAALVSGAEPFEATRQIHDFLSRHGPAVYASFNGLKFDEEILRTQFWISLLDPYVTSSRGSKRLDLLKAVQAVCASAPGAIAVGTTPNGGPSLKLETLARLNGYEGHEAHDALGDVRATLFLARLLRDRAPAIWEAVLRLSETARVEELLARPHLHLLTFFGAPKTLEVAHVVRNPANPKEAALYDLSVDPREILARDAAGIAALFATPADNPLKLVSTNKLPLLFAPGEPGPEPEERLAPETLEERRRLVTDPGFAAKVADALRLRKAAFTPGSCLEEKIYDGFPSWADKKLISRFHTAAPEERRAIMGQFADRRLAGLAERILWQTAPEQLAPGRAEALAQELFGRAFAGADAPFLTLEGARADLAEARNRKNADQAFLDLIEADLEARAAALAPYAVAAAQAEVRMPEKDGDGTSPAASPDGATVCRAGAAGPLVSA